jgi:hypothetical protein
LYPDYFAAPELKKMKIHFRETADKNGIIRHKEGGDITALWSKWGVGQEKSGRVTDL